MRDGSLMIGTGALAPQLIRVHAKVRPIEEVAIWGRRPDQAASLARELSASLPQALARPIAVRAVADRRQAVGEADIISCATLSSTPLVEGDWLRAGQHVDLVGAYTPKMRESDDRGGAAGAGLCRHPRRRPQGRRRHRPAAGQRHDQPKPM